MESIGALEIWFTFFIRFIPVWICLAIFYFGLFYWKKRLGLLGRLCDSPIGLIGLFIVLFWIFGAILADWVAMFDAYEQSGMYRRKPPGTINTKVDLPYIFGTDTLGRDLFSRVLLGTRVSLSIGIMAVLISTFIGLFFGSLGGYYGGLIDKIVVYIINVFWSIPTLLLVIAISLSLGKGFWQVYIAIGFSVWVDVARLVRGKVISEKNKDYISASKILGFNNFRIIVSHILPNITGPILIIAAANFASSILLESGLSFLGIGTQPPLPSWGYMIKENYQYIILGNAYLALTPAICLVLLVSSFMFISNYHSEKKL